MSTVDENLVAVWEIAGEDFQQIYDLALHDAQLFMNNQTGWRFFVMACHPIEFAGEGKNEDPTLWKGQAVIRWIEDS